MYLKSKNMAAVNMEPETESAGVSTMPAAAGIPPPNGERSVACEEEAVKKQQEKQQDVDSDIQAPPPHESLHHGEERGKEAATEARNAEEKACENGDIKSKDLLCVAVDLGTHNSVVASCLWKKQQTATVECNALANRSTPSTIAFDGKVRLSGEEADAKASSNQLNTVANVAMWLRVRSEAALKLLKQRLPFSSFPRCSFDSKGALQFEVSFADKNVQVPFVLVLAHYLKTLVGFASGGGGERGAEKIAAVGLALPTSAAGDSADFATVSAAAALAGLPGFLSLAPEPSMNNNSSNSNSSTDSNSEGQEGGASGNGVVGGVLSHDSPSPLVMTHADALLNCWCCRHLPQVYYDLRDQQQQRQQQQQEEEQQARQAVSETSAPPTTTTTSTSTATTTTSSTSPSTPSTSTSSSSADRVLLVVVDAGYGETTIQVAELREILRDKTAAAAASDGATTSEQQQQQQTNKRQKEEKKNSKIAVERLALEVDDFGTVDMINALAHHLCNVLKQQHPKEPPVTPHSKRALRMFSTCQRAVRDLSGLQDTSLSIEGFLENERDFSCVVSRAEFEDLCAPLKTRLHTLVQRALKRSGRMGTYIAGVETVGGGSRVPWVQETLADAVATASTSSTEGSGQQREKQGLEKNGANVITQQQLRRTLDGSSSAAIGAALAAAGVNDYVRPILESNRKLAQQQPIPAPDLQAARALGEEMTSIETAELRRCSMRNTLESYLLQMQSALQSGPHRELLRAADAAGPVGSSPADEQEQQQQQGQHEEQQKEQQVNGSATGGGWLRELLQTQEHWLLDHADAAEEEYRLRYEHIKSELETRCPAYFEAVAHAKQQKEAEMTAAAAETRANNAAEGGGGGGGTSSSLDRDMNIKLPNSQCLKRAKKNKDEGNEFFKGGNTEVAVQRYVLALQYVAKLFDMSPQDKAEADSIKLACNLNLAQAYLRLSAADAAAASSLLNRAVSCCDAALTVDSKSLKALYRRALSRERLREFELAKKDVQEGLLLSPADEDFIKLRDRLEKQLRLQKEKAKKMYAKMFA